MRKKHGIILMLLAVMLLSGSVYAKDGKSDYTLDRVVVLSRHNIRSPLSGSGSLRGAMLETLMGQ